jgi:hypothetical protein
MHLFRSGPNAPPSDGITVHFTVDIQQEDSLPSFYDDRPATPLVPVLLSQLTDTPQEPPLHSSDDRFSMLAPTSHPFAEAALHTIARNEMRGFHTMFALPEPSAGRTVFAASIAARLVWSDVNGLLLLGQRLMTAEALEDHARAIPADDIEINVSVDYWMQRLELLKIVDAPLFHMLRDSLHVHTPPHILYRWNALKERLIQAGHTLATLIREAEQLARRKWPPMVLELYFLLLELVTHSRREPPETG